MANFIPLKIVAGQVQQFQAGDTISSTIAPGSGGPGGATWTEAEIDFGSTPTFSESFTITDATSAVASKIVALPSGKVATGRVGDDWTWDGLVLACLPGVGSFILSALAIPGPVVGKRKIQYQINT